MMTHHQGERPTRTGSASAPQASSERTRGEPKPIASRRSCASRGAATALATSSANARKNERPATAVPMMFARSQTWRRKLRPKARAAARSSSITGTTLIGLRRSASSAPVVCTDISSGARRRAQSRAFAACSQFPLRMRREASRTSTVPYSGRLRAPRSTAFSTSRPSCCSARSASPIWRYFSRASQMPSKSPREDARAAGVAGDAADAGDAGAAVPGGARAEAPSSSRSSSRVRGVSWSRS